MARMKCSNVYKKHIAKKNKQTSRVINSKCYIIKLKLCIVHAADQLAAIEQSSLILAISAQGDQLISMKDKSIAFKLSDIWYQ